MTVVVMKVGGSLGGRHLNVVTAAVEAARAVGLSVVIVHGGGPEISKALTDRNLSMPFVGGQRQTTVEGVAVVEEVLNGQVNPRTVGALRDLGVDAVGLFGTDGILIAEPFSGVDRTGRVVSVAPEAVNAAIEAGRVTVLSPVATDAAGLRYNVNADLAAAAVAGAMSADKLVFFTDVPGIYSNWTDKVRLTDTTALELRRLLDDGAFYSGMIPKVNAVLAAHTAGVRSVYVIQGDQAETAREVIAHRMGAPWHDAWGTCIQAENGGIR